MRLTWIWALPLLAMQGLTACATGGAAPATVSARSAPANTQAMLSAYHWHLREVRDSQGQRQSGWRLPPAPVASGANPPDSARTVQLDFAQGAAAPGAAVQGRVVVGRLCNALSASYQLDDKVLRIGPMVGTMMACEDSAAMALERRIGHRLPQVSHWTIDPAREDSAPVLTLTFQDKGQWLLDGDPTDATRYGSPGERIFLEVAPQRVPCSHPLMPQHTCLQVRSIQYGSQGLKTRTGPWEVFPGEIQGYTHEPGVRNVLRIQRYPQPLAPADAPADVHVLDMTVESEIVR